VKRESLETPIENKVIFRIYEIVRYDIGVYYGKAIPTYQRLDKTDSINRKMFNEIMLLKV
jgi:hypothetical protein